MIRIVSFILIASAAVVFADSEWKSVTVRNGEAVMVLSHSAGFDYTPDPSKNEYPVGYVFPTTDLMYWKKQGSDWVAMNADEKLVVDNSKKQKTLDLALDDAALDAILDVIAKAVKDNLKTKDEIKQAFKDSVDPKKADKKEK